MTQVVQPKSANVRKQGKPKTLVVAVKGTPACFDQEQPGSWADWEPSRVTQLLTDDQLVGYRVGVKQESRSIDCSAFEGRLADFWEVSSDKKSYTFHLRKGVKSSYGNEMTAEDIVWGWERSLALRSTGKWFIRASHLRVPEGIEVIDDYTARFRLEAPCLLFPHLMTLDVPAILDSKEARKHATTRDPWAKEWLATHFAGYGPYKLESVTPGVEMIFAGRSDYWAGPPKVDKVVHKVVHSQEEALAQLVSGEVDILPSLSFEEARKLQGKSGIRLLTWDGWNHITLEMQQKAEPFSHRKVRQAIAYAIPYEEILETVYQGTAAAWKSPIPANCPGYTEEFWHYDTDLEKSRGLLEEAGYTKGFKTTISFDVERPEFEKTATLLRSSLSKIGVDVSLTPYPRSQLPYGKVAADFGLLIRSEGHKIPTAAYALWHDFAPGRMGLVGNLGAYDNEQFTKIMMEGVQEPDEARQRKLFRRAQQTLLDDVAIVPLAQPSHYVGIKANIVGYALYWDTRVPYEEIEIEKS